LCLFEYKVIMTYKMDQKYLKLLMAIKKDNHFLILKDLVKVMIIFQDLVIINFLLSL